MSCFAATAKPKTVFEHVRCRGACLHCPHSLLHMIALFSFSSVLIVCACACVCPQHACLLLDHASASSAWATAQSEGCNVEPNFGDPSAPVHRRVRVCVALLLCRTGGIFCRIMILRRRRRKRMKLRNRCVGFLPA